MFHPNGPSFFELARQALSSTERGYDLLAPKFDVTPFRTPRGILDKTAEYLGPGAPFERALDLCCGTGAVMEVLQRAARRLVVGLDFSGGMLRVASRNLQIGGPRETKVALVRADALAAPFRSSFDLVTCFSALGHFLPSEHEALVRSIRRCLLPGGRFVFLTGTMPERSSRAYWFSRAFNATMHIRNTLWRPRFTMYYLTFLLPEAAGRLEREGFELSVEEDIFEPPYERYCLVDARRKS